MSVQVTECRKYSLRMDLADTAIDLKIVIKKSKVWQIHT